MPCLATTVDNDGTVWLRLPNVQADHVTIRRLGPPLLELGVNIDFRHLGIHYYELALESEGGVEEQHVAPHCVPLKQFDFWVAEQKVTPLWIRLVVSTSS